VIFLPLFLAHKTINIGEKIAELSNEKIKEEAFYSTLLKEENTLKYALIRGEIRNVKLQRHQALASLRPRSNSTFCIHFVYSDNLDIANR